MQRGFLYRTKNIKSLPSLLFQHNVESEIPRRHFREATNVVAKLFWYIQWKKIVRFEKRQCRKFDSIIAVSENDELPEWHSLNDDMTTEIVIKVAQ